MPVEMFKIREIKRKHEGKWQSVAGVTAVGIGKTSSGEYGIIISVKKIDRRVKKEIPNEIDGVPIQIQETGEIKVQ
jgi:hypothetical protein